MMDERRARDTGRLALAVGAVAAGSAVCLGTYFVVGGPFGTINDVGNAGIGVLSAALAWRLRGSVPGRTGLVAHVAAIGGAALTVAGSALVVSGTTGFLLAGLVSSVGFAGIGTWLLLLNRSAGAIVAWPQRLVSMGMLAGALMAVGVASAPGIPMRLDDPATAPGWAWIGFLSWLGTYVAYPAWGLWLAAVESRAARAAQVVPA
jgi:hypothetical protein